MRNHSERQTVMEGRRPPPKMAWSTLAADELPTTLRRSPPPPLPLRAMPTMDREPLPSLASILEPHPWARSRHALVPPDPRAFGSSKARSTWSWGCEGRWLARIALLLFVVGGELVLADPSGALHRPRDLGDAGAMLSTAARASLRTVFGR